MRLPLPGVNGPLAGLRVLDLTRVLAGPFATMMLADLGAEVIKVERPGDGDETRSIPPHQEGESHYFMSINRNKPGIVVDLKDPRGREVALDLARRSEVCMDNFRPGVAGRLGLDHDALRSVNPEIICASISAFGQTGPWAGRSAFDVAMQAMAGAMSLTGEPGGTPMRMGLPMADLGTGLVAVIGVLAAVVEKQRTGRGQMVDISMFDAMTALLTQFAGRWFMTGESAEPVGSGHPGVSPYGAYEAADGHIVIANLGESFWPKIALAIGRPELAGDERYLTNQLRLERRAEIDGLITAATRTRPVAEWERIFEAHDVPHAPVMRVGQVLEHPQAAARGMVTEIDHPKLGRMRTTGRAIHFPAHDRDRFEPAPLLGQHTDEVLREVLGYPSARIQALRSAGVVA